MSNISYFLSRIIVTRGFVLQLNVLEKLASMGRNATNMDASAKKIMKAVCVTKVIISFRCFSI